MNTAYKTLWNAALGAWVAVSETTRARGKRSTGRATRLVGPLIAATGFAMTWPAWAACVLTDTTLDCAGINPGWQGRGLSNLRTINNTGSIGAPNDNTYGVFVGDNVTINNLGSISSSTGIVAGSGLVLNNLGGTINSLSAIIAGGALTVHNTAGTINATLGVAIQSRDAAFTLTNSDGGLVQGQRGLEAFAGGTILNTGNSRIVGTRDMGVGFGNSGSGDIINTFGATISGPLWSVYAKGAPIKLDNAGLLQGDVALDASQINQVTLRTGGQIAGNLSIGNIAGSTLTLDGDGTQLYSQAVTGSTNFGGMLIKNGGGDWQLDRALAPTSVSVNAGALGFLAGSRFDTTTAVNLAAGAKLYTLGNSIPFIGDLTGAKGSAVSLASGSALALSGNASTTVASDISGLGQLIKTGTGVLTLSGDNSGFAGALSSFAGTLELASAQALGAARLFIGGPVTLSARTPLTLNNAISIDASSPLTITGTAMTLGGRISGTAVIVKQGTDELTLSGANTYLGRTTALQGTLRIANATGSATGQSIVSVAGGATLTGTGSIAGPVSVAADGHLSVGTGTGVMNTGALTLAAGASLDMELGQAGVAGGPLNDLLNVNGDLSLGGKLNLRQSAGGSFGAGVYRLINYTGALTGNTMTIGSAPLPKDALSLQTSVANQVNLVNAGGLLLGMWDGNNPANFNDGKIAGGNGLWISGPSPSFWTDADGAMNTGWVQDGFAVFAGKAGTVTVDNTGTDGPVRIGGAQFSVDGYVVNGGPLTIGAPATTVRVGDGTAASAGMTATLNAAIGGAGGLVKEDGGTLVLNGANTYAGGTTIKGGVLQIVSDANLGAAGTGLTLDGGTLRVPFNTQVGSTRPITLGTGGGTFDLPGGEFDANSSIDGIGSLTVTGAFGGMALGAANTYSGGTVVRDGGSVAGLVNGAFGKGAVQVQGDGARVILNRTTTAGSNAFTVGRTGSTDRNDVMQLQDNASAGTANITVNGSGWQDAGTNRLAFFNNSNAGSATIANAGGLVLFQQSASAGTSTITNGDAGALNFQDTSTAGSATIVNGDKSRIVFATKASAGTATLRNLSGGSVFFTQNASASTATLSNAEGGTVDVSTAPNTEIGSLSGAGAVVLGKSALTLGGLNTSDAVTGVVSGSGGAIVKVGSGTLRLTGDNTYTGGTTVVKGTLSVNNTAGSATGTGAVQVLDGATLAGSGRIAGAVTIGKGGILSAGNSPGTLTLGALTLAEGATLNYDLGQAGVPGGTLNDLVQVGGDLRLDGTLNVAQSAGGSFGPGLYRLFSYGGTLSDNGLDIGAVPAGTTQTDLQVQTSLANQVNLVNRAGLSLNFWDGGDSGKYNDGQVAGGSGTWRVGSAPPSPNGWTDMDGKVNASWTQGQFAVFGGKAGTVTVDASGGTVQIAGAQFAVDGYRVQGDAIELANAATTVRVGDGTAAGAGMKATITSSLIGTGGLVKEDLGTLVLEGLNTYSGGTTIRGGTLQVASDSYLGAPEGGLALEGGATLHVTGGTSGFRAVTLGAGIATFDVVPVETLSLGGVVSGAGRLRKIGPGLLQLSAVNTYTGGTEIVEGRINATVSGALGSGPVSVGDSATLVFANTTAAGALAITVAARAPGTNGGFLWFRDNSSAGSTAITNLGGTVSFTQKGSAGSATISNGDKGLMSFADSTSAGNATVRNLSGGTVYFRDAPSAAAATITNAQGGTVDVSGLNAAGSGGISIGSLSGAGAVVLGATQLTLGGLNASDAITGAISDKGSQFVQPGSGTGGSIVKVGSGTLALSGANSYTGGTVLRQGRLNVDNSQALGTGALSMDNDATLGFDADNVNLANAIRLTGQRDPVIDTGAFSSTLSGAISGGGFITKEGTGTLTLSGANTYSGATNVAQGSLKASAANSFSAASAHNVAAGATLDLSGFNQTVASLANSGTVSLVGNAPGTTLTVNGNYVGNNGVLRLGATLNGAGPSDRLVINGGAATGKTSVQLINLGGLGALTSGNGIEVITALNGATTTAQTTKDAFSLAGGHVDAGAYEYRLNAGDAMGAGENWYLRSSIGAGAPSVPIAPVTTYRAEASLYAALPSQLRQGSLAMLGDLRKRVGDDDVKGTAGSPTGSDRRAWGRVLSTDIDVRQGGAVSPTSKGRLTGFQAGTDLLVTPNWRAGLYVGRLDGDATVNGFASGVSGLRTGRSDLRSEYVGVYGTYTGDSGFYADAVLQAGRHRYTVQPTLSRGMEGKGRSLLASIEVGQSFALGGGGWSVEPQLQLIHQRMSLDDSAISGALVQPRADSGWIARAGVRVKGQIDTGVGVLQPYGRFNVYRTSGGTDIARFVNGVTVTDIAAPTGGTSTELAGGFTLALSPSTSLYGELGKLWASGGDAKVKSSVNGSVGVRVRW